MKAPGNHVGAAAGRGRLIVHGPRDPRFNMACDEALGLCAREPVLRFYGWEPPALSLGYFQDAAEVEPFRGRLGSPPVVRRITGGGAIYHYRELTYSIVAPPGCLPLPADTAASYRFLHAPFIAVLNGMASRRGTALCGKGKSGCRLASTASRRST